MLLVCVFIQLQKHFLIVVTFSWIKQKTCTSYSGARQIRCVYSKKWTVWMNNFLLRFYSLLFNSIPNNHKNHSHKDFFYLFFSEAVTFLGTISYNWNLAVVGYSNIRRSKRKLFCFRIHFEQFSIFSRHKKQKKHKFLIGNSAFFITSDSIPDISLLTFSISLSGQKRKTKFQRFFFKKSQLE